MPSRLVCLSAIFTRSIISAFGTLRTRSGKATFSKMFMCGHTANDWNTMPSPRSSGGTYRFLLLMLTGRPHRWISPSLRSSNPAIMRSVVVLPQPLGPRKEKHSPSLMVRLKSLTAVTVPSVLVVNCLVT